MFFAGRGGFTSITTAKWFHESFVNVSSALTSLNLCKLSHGLNPTESATRNPLLLKEPFGEREKKKQRLVVWRKQNMYWRDVTCCEPEVTGLISVCGIRKSELYGSLLYATVISSHKLRPRMTSLLQQQPVRLVSSAAQSKQQQQHPRRTLVQTLSPLIGSESLYLQCERSLKDELTSSLFF